MRYHSREVLELGVEPSAGSALYAYHQLAAVFAPERWRDADDGLAAQATWWHDLVEQAFVEAIAELGTTEADAEASARQDAA